MKKIDEEIKRFIMGVALIIFGIACGIATSIPMPLFFTIWNGFFGVIAVLWGTFGILPFTIRHSLPIVRFLYKAMVAFLEVYDEGKEREK